MQSGPHSLRGGCLASALCSVTASCGRRARGGCLVSATAGQARARPGAGWRQCRSWFWARGTPRRRIRGFPVGCVVQVGLSGTLAGFPRLARPSPCLTRKNTDDACSSLLWALAREPAKRSSAKRSESHVGPEAAVPKAAGAAAAPALPHRRRPCGRARGPACKIHCLQARLGRLPAPPPGLPPLCEAGLPVPALAVRTGSASAPASPLPGACWMPELAFTPFATCNSACLPRRMSSALVRRTRCSTRLRGLAAGFNRIASNRLQRPGKRDWQAMGAPSTLSQRQPRVAQSGARGQRRSETGTPSAGTAGGPAGALTPDSCSATAPAASNAASAT